MWLEIRSGFVVALNYMVNIMQFIKETFRNLQPVENIKRSPIDGYSGFYLEQNKTGFTFQLKFKSPVTGKYRFIKLSRFKYGDNINKKMLDNVVSQLVINQGEVIKGIDPLEQKTTKTTTQAPTIRSKTVNKVFDIYTSSHHFKKLSENSQIQYLSLYKNHLAKRWGKISVANISRPDVVTFLNDVEMDATYNGIKTTFQAIQSQALDLGLIEAPFMFGVKRRQSGSRTQTLTDAEIITLMTSTAGWDSLRNICKMQLLTGCRNGEVSGMRWEEIDMKAKTWTIPPERIKTEKAFKKMNRPHVLPLMPKMSEILLQQRQHGTTGLVFKKQRHFKNSRDHYFPHNCGRWMKLELDIDGGTHQLRRTTATSLANMKGISELDVKIVLNHAVSGNTQKYINTQYLDRKLELFTKWHNYIEQLINPVKMVSGGVR